jgi:hypothetical protein
LESDDSEKSGHCDELTDASLQNTEISSNPLALRSVQSDDCNEDDTENLVAFVNQGDVDSSNNGDDSESDNSQYDIENHNENNLNDENISILTSVNQNSNHNNIDNDLTYDNDSEEGDYGTNISEITTINTQGIYICTYVDMYINTKQIYICILYSCIYIFICLLLVHFV